MNKLPPKRDVQHATNFILGSQLPNLLAYCMNDSEFVELKSQLMNFWPTDPFK